MTRPKRYCEKHGEVPGGLWLQFGEELFGGWCPRCFAAFIDQHVAKVTKTSNGEKTEEEKTHE